MIEEFRIDMIPSNRGLQLKINEIIRYLNNKENIKMIQEDLGNGNK